MLLADNAVLGISWGTDVYGENSYIERMDGPARYLRLGSSYLFNCCGASPIDCLSYKFRSEEEIQNFVCFVYRHLAGSQTYYMIAATYQLEDEYGKFGNVIQLLRKLGAKEVDDTPNRNHGPNLMHLHRWVVDLGDWSIWAPYLATVSGRGVNPLWYSKLTDEQKATVSADAKALKVAYDVRTKRANELRDKQKKDDLVYKARRLIDSGALTEYLQQKGWEKKNGIEQKSVPVGTTGGFVTNLIW